MAAYQLTLAGAELRDQLIANLKKERSAVLNEPTTDEAAQKSWADTIETVLWNLRDLDFGSDYEMRHFIIRERLEIKFRREKERRGLKWTS